MTRLERARFGNQNDGLVEGAGPKLVLFEGLLYGCVEVCGCALRYPYVNKIIIIIIIPGILITAFGFYSSRSNVQTTSGLGPNHNSSRRYIHMYGCGESMWERLEVWASFSLMHPA